MTKRTKIIEAEFEGIERAVTAAKSKQPRFGVDKKNLTKFFYQIYGWEKEAIFNEPKYAADSKKRDEWLAKVVLKEPYLLSILQSVVSIDKNRGWTLVGGRNQVNRFTDVLHNFQVSPDLYGWRNGTSVSAQSYYQADLGAIIEIGRTQKNGAFAALYSVDPTKCFLTGNPDTPLRYSNAVKDKQEWSANDFFRVVSFPNPSESMNGLGYCAISRCIELAKLLVSVFEHDRERLGTKAPKGLLLINGITQDQWLQSLEESNAELKTLEREYYTGVQVLANSGLEKVSAKLVSLSTLPDQFDHLQFVNLMIWGYALAFGYDPREFWPVSGGSLGTGKETETQHRKATSKGGLDFALGFQEKLQEELPETIEFEFEQRDVEGDIAEVAFQKSKLDVVSQLYTGVNSKQGEAGSQPLITFDEARQLLVEAMIIPDTWTAQGEDLQVTDTEDAGEIMEKQRVRNAMMKFPDEDIVRYSSNDNKVRVIRKAGEHKFQLRVFRKIKKVRSGGADYEGVRNDYWASIYDAVEGYLTGNQPVTSFRNSMLDAMNSAFQTTAELGYTDAGGEVPLDDETQSWLDGATDAERGNITGLFDTLSQNWEGLDPIDEAFARADGYTATLDSIYAQALMMGGENATLEFVGDDGADSCVDCQAMEGKRHTIKYILENNLIPAPGNSNYACNGYNCYHYWMNTKTGEEYVA